MPPTLRDAVADAAAGLNAAGVDSPRLVAQVLLAHTLDVPRANIMAFSPRHLLQSHQLSTYRALVARCVAGEPMAYVVGHTEFYALDFATDRRALIPRPETEQLVELALARVKLQMSNAKCQIVDVGTGCGCIAVSLATHLPDARLIATDISADALSLAHENAQRHKVSSRIQFLHGDLLAPVPLQVEGVVANLPYVTTAEWQGLPRHIREHEPRIALDGGADGLDLIRRLFSQATEHVQPDGWLLLEIGATQGQAVAALARQAFPQASVSLHRDYAGLPRVAEIQFHMAPGARVQ
jgi:release factor glutamine methyltransferase